MLNTIIVDDSSICVNMLWDICSEFSQLNLQCFTNSEDAVSFCKSSLVNLAFLDVDMPNLNGLRLGQILRNINPDVMLIYVSSKEDSCPTAMRLKADGYIFKPYSISDISRIIERAYIISEKLQKSLFARTFGTFELFKGCEPIRFSNAKAKELLALCISYEGCPVNMETAISTLWPDRPINERSKRLYRKAISSIKDTIALYTDIEIFGNSRGSCYVYPSNLYCDHFLYKSNPTKYSYLAKEPYLKNYIWSKVSTSDDSEKNNTFLA